MAAWETAREAKGEDVKSDPRKKCSACTRRLAPSVRVENLSIRRRGTSYYLCTGCWQQAKATLAKIYVNRRALAGSEWA